MPVETTEKPFLLAENLLDRFQGVPQLELLKRACAFAQEYYADIVHPTSLPYMIYISHVVEVLVGLHANLVVISAVVVCPPLPVARQTFRELKRRFKDEGELLKLVDGILTINNLEWSIWPSSLQKEEARDRQEVLRKMFLLAIGEAESEDRDQNLQAVVHFQKKEKQVENLMRMLVVAAPDVRALVIKLADRLCLIMLLKDLPLNDKESLRYKEFARATIGVYAPIADRLGIWSLKSELEDMAFRLLQPEVYKEIAKKIDQKKQERVRYINDEIIPRLEGDLREYGIKNARIFGRPKHIYSIYRKMEDKGLDFNEINDLRGVRIIVDTMEDCYKALDMLSDRYYLPSVSEIYDGKVSRDWIERPKPNHYQSLHTTILFEGNSVEVQIRTQQMHEVAEYGPSAVHWRYKEGKAYRRGRVLGEVGTKDLIWNKEMTEVRKNLDLMKEQPLGQEGFLKRSIFVVTPKGHIIGLPTNSTPLDFAYRIHSEIGHKYMDAKVDGHIVSTSYGLKNGESVEIRTSRARKGPNPEWLRMNRDKDGQLRYVFAQTRQARSQIKRWLKLNGISR